jgi:hypothetical protein
MVNSILQLKEAVELLSGQRGDKYFASREDISLTQASINTLKKNTSWDTIYDQEFTAVTSVVIPKLSEYRLLKVSGYIKPSTTQPAYMRFSTNGAFISAATDYFYDILYTGSSSGTWAGVQGTTSVVPISGLEVVTFANNFGTRFDLVVEQFNQLSQTTVHGFLYYYTGAILRCGTLHIRPGTSGVGTLDQVCDGLMLLCGANTAFSGSMMLEGLKG